MYRQNFQHHSHGQGSPGHSGEPGFRSPMYRPRFQSSPRYHHGSNSFSGPGRPNLDYSGGGPPGRSPPYRSPRGEFSFNSPMHNSFDGGSPYHGHGRGNWSRGRGRGYHSQGSDMDCNPGGNDDINKYICPTMLQDPWDGLPPVPVAKGNTTST